MYITLNTYHDDIARNLALIDWKWANTRTKDTLGGSHKRILKAWMHATYGGLCILCETPTTLDASSTYADNYAHLGHLVSAYEVQTLAGESDTPGKNPKGGYVEGNLAIQCRKCNRANGHQTIPMHAIRRPQDVPLTWPSLTKRPEHRVAW